MAKCNNWAVGLQSVKDLKTCLAYELSRSRFLTPGAGIGQTHIHRHSYRQKRPKLLVSVNNPRKRQTTLKVLDRIICPLRGRTVQLPCVHWLLVHKRIHYKLAVLTYKRRSRLPPHPSTSAATSELGKPHDISVLPPCRYCTNRQPGLILPTAPSAAQYLLSGILWTATW